MEEGMYFITTVTDLSKNYHSRCVGYTKDKDLAIEVVEHNIADIFETMYHYAVIEKIPEGLYQYAYEEEDIMWFKYNLETDGYEKIDKPKEMKNICGFAIG